MSSTMVAQTGRIHLNGSMEAVFPLFTARGEYDWIPGWKAQYIYPPDGEPMTNNVFATQHAGQAQTIWVTVDYDPETGHVEYVNVTPELHAQRIEIQCQRTAEGGTDAEVTYTWIALSGAGEAAAAHHTPAAHEERMRQWETAINHTLAHGTLIPAH